MAKQGCKVYKRAGITHVCYKGFHYAPVDALPTSFDINDRVDIDDNPGFADTVLVAQGGKPAEIWAKTVVGDDDPSGYAKGSGEKKQREPKVAKPTVRKSNSSDNVKAPKVVRTGTMTEPEADELIKRVAPNPNALKVMQVCWHNWLRCTVPGNRSLTPFAGFQWPDQDATEAVQALGRRLAEQFADAPVK